jgi:hypothetical protein
VCVLYNKKSAVNYAIPSITNLSILFFIYFRNSFIHSFILSDEEVYELNWDSFNYDEIFLSSTYKVWRNIREYSLYYSVLIISATMIRMEINE